MSKKIGRNDKCICNSGKKYKNCCLEKQELLKKEQKDKFRNTLINGQDHSSDNILKIKDWILQQPEYKDINVIDVTDILSQNTYKQIQTTHYYAENGETIILANRTDESDSVFEERSKTFCDVILMFKGAYYTFTMEAFNSNNVKDGIKEMINIRLKNEDYKTTQYI